MSIKVSAFRFSLAIVMMLFSLFSMAQNKPVTLPTNSDHQIEYTIDVVSPNTRQSALLSKAMNWIVTTKTFKFKKIDMLDNSFGRLIASGTFTFNNDEVFLHLVIDVKDNKATLKVNRFDYNMQPGNIPLDNLTNVKTKEAKILIPQVAKAMPVLLKSFKDALLKPSAK